MSNTDDEPTTGDEIHPTDAAENATPDRVVDDVDQTIEDAEGGIEGSLLDAPEDIPPA